MALHLHRAPRTDLLAEALGDLLATPLGDPLAQEVVVVPARGVERWLTQRLSHRLGVGGGGDGVCAGVRFLQPRSLVSLLIGRETDDPWDPDRLVWPLLATIDASLGEPWCATLAAHLGHGHTGHDAELRRNRRYSVAIRLASLFASYAAQRPTLVTDWREGRDTDGAGRPLDADLAWQPELWRRLLGRVGRAGAGRPARRDRRGPARRGSRPRPAAAAVAVRAHAAAGHRGRAARGARRVPRRAPLPPAGLARAVGRARRRGGPSGVVAREDDESARLVGHPLLASLGRDARELRRSLDGAGFPDGDAVAPPADDRPSLLGLLQADLRANHAPDHRRAGWPPPRPGRPQPPGARVPRPSRQVDVLREVLVGLLQDDPTLEPRDILVMCPDIETYAPLISAGFGLAPTGPEAADGVGVTGHPAHRLRVKLADRALVSTNPLLAVAGVLLELSGGRVTASEVLDLAATEPCRRRFGFTDDELERAGRWVASTGVRWGLDQEARASFAMDKFPQNTWRTGLDRILLGVAMSGDDHRHLGTGPARSTTSAATRSTWPGGWPSCSTASTAPWPRSARPGR